MNSDRRELTHDEKAVAKRLKAAWLNAKAANKSMNQKWIADEVGANQPLIAQYLNGNRPIGTDTLLAICKAVGVSITEIDPIRADKLRSGLGNNAKPDEITSLYLELNEPSRNLIKSLIEYLSKH